MRAFILLVFLALQVGANDKVSDYVPKALKSYLPANVLKELNKLGPKDLKAIERLAARWDQYTSVKQFEKTLSAESRPLKSFVDHAIKAGHESLDKLVDKMHPETIKMAQQAGRLLLKTAVELKQIYIDGDEKAKQNLQELFPKTSFALSHPQSHITAVSYCGLLGGNGAANLGNAVGAFLNAAGLGNLGLNGGGLGNFGLNSRGVRGRRNRRLGSGWQRLLG